MDRAAEAGVGDDLKHLGEVPRREARLVAGHREADDVRVGVLGGVAGDAERLLDPEVAHGRDEDAALDAGIAASLVDPARDPVPVLLVAQADERRVVGRGGQLDVDRAAACARAQILVRDVAVVLAGAHHAGSQVVGAQEVEEVGVAKAPVVPEQILRKRQPVALRDPRH